MHPASDVTRLFGFGDTGGSDTMTFALARELGVKLLAGTPLGRFGEPEDIAPVAVFLASDDAHWVTGESLRAAGGVRDVGY
ncbi:hypothetical protein SAMN05216320_104249 [Duganella sp. OV458]|jgi:NAD(P)-dependent dehydrogenase (short-subunit alcohol dehydrogenase family)|nr:hypothetical protein SAMN05216320_104249 [Duganella sp. OV458]SDJ62568.1 Enoyl-(Acyl carrier protein) reductase [Duganella sp. OV510]